MSDRQLTYDTNADAYEYDPATQELMELPGVGMYVIPKGMGEEERQSFFDKETLTRDLHYSNLHKDTVLLDSWKRYYKEKEGEEYTGSDEEAVDDFMSEFAYIDNNLTFGLGKTLVNMQSMSEDVKFDVGLLYDRYNRTDSFGEGSRSFFDQFKDVTWAGVTDPLNFLGVGTLGIGFAARGAAGAVGGQAAKQALINGFKNTAGAGMLKKYGEVVARNPIKSSMLEGAKWGAVYDVEQQNVELESGFKPVQTKIIGGEDGFDYQRLGTTIVMGAGIGGGLGGTASLLFKSFRKGGYDQVLGPDRSKASLEELKAEAKERNITPKEEDASIIVQPFNKDTEQGETLNDVVITASDGSQYTTVGTVEKKKQTTKVIDGKRVSDVTVLTIKFRNKETGRLKKQEFIVDEEAPVSEYQQYKGALERTDKEEGTSPTGILARLGQMFSSEFGVGKQQAERYRSYKAAIAATSKEVDRQIQNIERIFREEKGIALDDASDEVKRAFVDSLVASKQDSPFKLGNKGFVEIGQKKNGKVWTEMQDAVQEYRTFIQNTSQELFDSGFILKKDAKGNESELAKTIEKNIKHQSYINTQYRLYGEPQYATLPLKELLGENQYNNTRSALMNKLELDETDASTLMEQIRQKSGVQELTKIGSLAKKRDIAPEVKIILGEVVSPKHVMANTILRTKRMTEEFKFRQDLVAIGLQAKGTKKFIIDPSGQGGKLAKLEAGKEGIRPEIEQLSRLLKEERVKKRVKELEKQADKNKDATNKPTELEEIEAQIKQEELTVENSSSFINDPFHNLYVDPTWKKAYDRMVAYKAPDALEKGLSYPTYWFRTTKLTLSPATHIRDFLGGNIFAIGNGLNPFSAKAWTKIINTEGADAPGLRRSVFRTTFPLYQRLLNKQPLPKETEKQLNRLVELGILHNGTRVNLLRESLNSMVGKKNAVDEMDALVDRLASKSGALGKAREKLIDPLTDTYGMWDNLNKITAFEGEFGWLYKGFGNGKDNEGLVALARNLDVPEPLIKRSIDRQDITSLIEQVAAAKVRNYMPTYSYLPPIHQMLRKVQLGNFTSFSMELIRNYKNSWKIARMEMLSKNPTMKARGSVRAGALAGMSAVSYVGADKASSLLVGLSEEERQAFEHPSISASWDAGTGNIFTSSIKDGKVNVIPLGFVDPYSYLSRISKTAINSFSEGDSERSFSEKLVRASADAFTVSLTPYLQPAAGPATIFKLGLDIYDDKEVDISGLDRAFTPQFIRDINNTAILEPLGIGSKETKWGTPKDPSHYVFASWITGMKMKTVDIPAKVGFAIKGKKYEQDKVKTNFNKLLNDPSSGIYEGDYKSKIMDAYKDMIEEHKRIDREINQIYFVGRKLGLSKQQMGDLMGSKIKTVDTQKAGASKYRSNFSQDYITQITADQYYIPLVSDSIKNRIVSTLEAKGKDFGDVLNTMDAYRQQVQNIDNGKIKKD